jgi:hypothetical protein
MNLINKKEVKCEDELLLISIDKEPFGRVNGTDYYIYYIRLYDYKINNGIKRIFKKHNLILSYSTDWLQYYKYNGEIDEIIKEALSKYEFNLREQKYISEKEKEWSEN